MLEMARLCVKFATRMSIRLQQNVSSEGGLLSWQRRFEFEEDNGAQTGSPLRGTTTTAARTEVNWKNVDDSTTAYSSSPILAGNNSYTKFQYGHYSGSYNQISAGLWAHTAGTLGTGLTLKGVVTSSYATPATSANGALTTDMTSSIAIGSGATVLFSGTGPYDASPTSSTTSNPAYSQYLATQLQTTGSAAAGDTATVTLTLQYNEN